MRENRPSRKPVLAPGNKERVLKQNGAFAEAVGVPHLQLGSGVFVACAQLPLGTAMPAVLGMVGQWLVLLHNSGKTLILVFEA